MTFRVDKCYRILGFGWIATGMAESGTVRPPVTLRLVPGDGRPDAPPALRVTQAMANRRAVAELGVGVKAGLALQSPPEAPPPVPARWNARPPVHPGDRLTLP